MRRLSRRRVLQWGAAGVAAQWLALPARAATLAGLGLRADEPVSVGYLDYSEQLDWLDFLPWEYDAEDWRWRIVPASSLPSGDPVLAVSGVRVTVHGLYPRPSAEEAAALPTSAYLTFLYDPEVHGARPWIYYAWGLSCQPGLSVGQRVSFVAPVHREDGLSLAMEVLDPVTAGGAVSSRLERVTAAGSVSRRVLRSASLSVGGEDLRPRLVRGIYFLGLSAGAFERPVDVGPPDAPTPVAMRSLVISVEPLDDGW